MSFGTIIKNIRIKNNLTQTELGKKLGVGKSTISAYEHNKIMPPTDVFVKICEIGNIEILFKSNNKISTIKEFAREY